MWINKSKRYWLPTLCRVLIDVTLVFPLTDLFGMYYVPCFTNDRIEIVCTCHLSDTHSKIYHGKWGERISPVQREQGFMKQVAFDLTLERWEKRCSCSRKAVLIVRATCGAPWSALGPADRVEFRLQRKGLFLMQNASLSGVCQERVGKLGSWLQLCAGRRRWSPPAFLRMLWLWCRFCCFWMWSQVSAGGWCVKHEQAMQSVFLGVRKECRVTRENGKIIHFHIRGCWTVAPPLSCNNLDQQPKKQHVKKIKLKTQGPMKLSLSFECDDKPHWIKMWVVFYLEFSFYAWQFQKPSRVNPHFPPQIVPGGLPESPRDRINIRSCRELSELRRPRLCC